MVNAADRDVSGSGAPIPITAHCFATKEFSVEHAQHTQNGSPQIDPTTARPESPAAESASSDGAMDRRVLLGFAGLAGVAALAKLAQAGPLEPPQGPISSTGTTLSELSAKTSEATVTLNAIERKVARTPSGISEPRIPITACPPSATAQFVITEPGAYYLPSNLVQQPGLACVDIQCSDVDIDGQGFSFIGSGNAASPPSSCIRCSNQQNIEIYDCSFVGWSGDCCSLVGCDNCALSDIHYRTCTCPPGYYLARCGNGACIEDVMVSSCSGNLLCGHTSHFRSIQVHGSVCTPTCGDGCCIEDCTFSSSSGGVDSTGGAAPMITCGSSCCITECDFRMCTCPAGRCGSSCVIECCEVTSCAGGWVCEDSCLVDDCTFVSLSGPPVTCGSACCVTECNIRVCTCPAGYFVRAGSDSVVENTEFSGGSCLGAILCDSACCVTECNFRTCTCPAGYVIRVGSDSVVECNEITGGASLGAIVVDTACCVEECTVISHQGPSITCSSSCSVCRCKCLAGYSGISCEADCVIEENEVSVAAAGTSGGGGPAIAVSGGRGKITCNYVRRGGIALFDGSNGCCVEDNTVFGGDGPPGTDGGSISLAASVRGCIVRGNSIRNASTTSALFIPPGNAFGPVVNATQGGDLSTLSGGSHPMCNCVHL